MKISVIVPIYNVELYLRRCLDSIDAQSFLDYEVLLINDGTKDGSGFIAKEYCNTHFKFSYYEKENGGLGSARNFGMRVAKGEYFAFVDSDDWIQETYLEHLYTACIDADADISMCGINRVWDNGRCQPFQSGFHKSAVFVDVREVIRNTSNVACNKLIRAELFTGIWFPERITYEDMACIPRVMLRAKRIAYVEERLYNYFWRSSSITLANRKNVNHDILKAFEILENSELGKEKDILAAIYVKVVVCSYLWSLFANGEDASTRLALMKKLSTDYYAAYRQYDAKRLGNQYWIFLKLCRTNNDFIIKLFVKAVCVARDLTGS